MKHKEAIAVIENRFMKINTSLQLVLVNFSNEEIHRFRVEIKKLRAFLHMLKAGSKYNHGLKLSARVKKIFRVIGAIRNLQLQQFRIKKIIHETNDQLPFEYLDMLNKVMDASIAKARNLIGSKKTFRKEKQSILAILRKWNGKIKTQCFLATTSGLLKQQLLDGAPNDKSLHWVRKILKDILYAQPYIAQKMRSSLPFILSDQANVKLLTSLLGDFQDACMGLSLLQPDDTDDLPEHERIFLKNVEKEWQEEKIDIRKKIMGHLKHVQSAIIPVMPEVNEIYVN